MVDESGSFPEQASLPGKSRKRKISSVYNSVTTHCWQIVDFKEQWTEARDNGKDLVGDTFSLISRPCIRLALAFESAEEVWSENWYGITVKDFGSNKDIEIAYKHWFQNEQGHKFSMREFSNDTLDVNNNAIGWDQLDKEDAPSLSDLYENNEALYFCCQITDLNPLVEDEHEEFLMNHWALFERGDHDAVIKIGDLEFKILKSYFIAQSEVFAKMFSASFKEGQTNVVEINDISEETMKALIKWLYTGQLEDGSPTSDLFIAADKYNIKLLKKFCIRRLCSTMGKRNAIWRLKLAVMHCEDKLKNSALHYISQMSGVEMGKMLTGSKWIEFSHKNVAISDEINKLINDKMYELESE